jgi:hypothetical protein
MNTKQFATRFSLENWNTLCASADFNAAVEASDFGLAEVIAHRILTASPSVDADHRHYAGQLENLVTIHIPSAEKELAHKKTLTNAPNAVRRAEAKLNELNAQADALRAKINRN